MRVSPLFRRPVPLVAFAGVATALGLVACNFVVGVGNFEVGAVSDDGGSNLDATTSQDASDASSEAGGDSAVGCGSSFPTTAAFKQVVQSCVLAAGCTGKVSATSISECISTHELASNANNSTFTCLENATTCAMVTNCTGLAWATAQECPTTNTSSTPVGHCVGGTAVTCEDGIGTTINCSKYAGTDQCGVHAAGTGDAGTVADCVVDEPCKPDAGSAVQCDTTDNTLYECYGDAGFGASCTNAGNKCFTYDGVTGCYYEGPTSCTTPGALTCTSSAGGTLCADTSTLLTFDCSAAGAECVTSGTAAACVSPGCTFTQATTTCKESCANDDITANFCVGGATYPVRCTDFPDFAQGGCVVQENGFATCVP